MGEREFNYGLLNQDEKVLADKILGRINQYFCNESSGHDLGHLERVLDSALKIQKIEGGNREHIIVSCLLHDIHRIMQGILKRIVTPEESLPTINKILSSIKYKDKEAIKEIIKVHENKAQKNLTIEQQILQDGDILDAIGQIGLERTKKYCIKYNIPFFVKGVSLNDPSYVSDYHPISTCHYIYRTMLPNMEYLHTNTAKKLGKDATKPLIDFLKQYYTKEEIKNENGDNCHPIC